MCPCLTPPLSPRPSHPAPLTLHLSPRPCLTPPLSHPAPLSPRPSLTPPLSAPLPPGYCGADLRSLCTEAALNALRRRYPQIYLSDDRLQLDVASISVEARDFARGVAALVPAAQRAVVPPSRALPRPLVPLLGGTLRRALSALAVCFPVALTHTSAVDTPGQWAHPRPLAPTPPRTATPASSPSHLHCTPITSPSHPHSAARSPLANPMDNQINENTKMLSVFANLIKI